MSEVKERKKSINKTPHKREDSLENEDGDFIVNTPILKENCPKKDRYGVAHRY